MGKKQEVGVVGSIIPEDNSEADSDPGEPLTEASEHNYTKKCKTLKNNKKCARFSFVKKSCRKTKNPPKRGKGMEKHSILLERKR